MMQQRIREVREIDKPLTANKALIGGSVERKVSVPANIAVASAGPSLQDLNIFKKTPFIDCSSACSFPAGLISCQKLVKFIIKNFNLNLEGRKGTFLTISSR